MPRTSSLLVQKERLMLYCKRKSTTLLEKERVTAIKSLRYPLIFTILIAVEVVIWGLVLSLWLHFIPCWFWTCDWGPHDGEGFRGLIWFISWPIITISLFLLSATMKLSVTFTAENSGAQKTCVISIGDGCTFHSTEEVRSEIDKFRGWAAVDELPPNDLVGRSPPWVVVVNKS